MMSLDDLYPRVTEAIERAEALEDANASAEARAAYLDVSMLEEEIASEIAASDVEGVLARRGAVRAALNAGVFARAKELADRYATEADLAPEIRAEIRAMGVQANDSLELDAIRTVRVVSAARYRLHEAA